MKHIFRWVCDYDARHRLFAAVCIAALSFISLRFAAVSRPTLIVATWDSFAVCALALTWLTIIAADPHYIRQQARMQDLSRILIFVFTVVATCASLFAVIFLLSRAKKTTHLPLHVTLSILAVVAAWSLMQTVFALRYAHIYYGDSDDPNKHAGGLEFPGDDAPDYLDFAYFAFVIGMTCQVSDVGISSKPLRTLALLQGVLSFGFNTVILALAINTIADFFKVG
jgi:uncharacterized membrane protein